MSNSSEPLTEPLDTLCQASSAVNILDLPKARNPVMPTIRLLLSFTPSRSVFKLLDRLRGMETPAT